MISPEKFKDLVKVKYYNQSDYWDNVVTPILDGSGVPKGADVRRREFPITTHWGDRNADWLIFVNNRPILVIEAEYSAQRLDKALADAKTFATNFNPKRKEDRQVIGVIRNVPYVFAACGNKLVMAKLVTLEDGLTNGLEFLPGLLTYEELKQIANRSVKPTGAKPLEKNLLATNQFRINFEEICEAIEGRIPEEKFKFRVSNPKDLEVFVLNEILLATFHGKDREIVYKNYEFPKKVIRRIEETLNRYDLTQIEGPDLAYAYREFVTQNFTGEGFGYCDKKEVGRYLTPAEVISFMVKLVGITPKDKVIDFACGSGGFLGAIASRMLQKTDLGIYLKEKLYACDIDAFSVSTTQTFMELLLPGKQLSSDFRKEYFYAKSLRPGKQISLDDIRPTLGIAQPPRLDFDREEGILNIYHHNGLFSKKVHSWEKDITGVIKDEDFDVVVSNPPGGETYELGHENRLRKLYPLSIKKLQNAPLFIQRAIQLAKNSGRICLIVPDGVLANTQLQYLREYVFKNCEVKAIISLPRGIFPNVQSKTSVLYVEKCKKPPKKQEIFFAGFEISESSTIETELNEIYEKYQRFQEKNK